MIILKSKLLVIALSVPILCSTCFVDSLNVFAIGEDDNTTSSIVEEVSNESTTKEKDVSETESNFPDKNGELLFWMDDIEENTPCSLTLTYTTEGDDKPISGAKVSAYKIASLSVSYGDAKYSLIDELKKDYPNLDFAGMSSKELDTIAEEMSNKNIKEVKEITTDNKGICKFDNLEPGLYLIKEKAKIGMAKDYEYFKSFIINVPFPKTEEGVYNGHWIYSVDSLPKTELKGKKKIIITPPSPQTGDNTNEKFLFGSTIAFVIASIGALISTIIIISRKKKNKIS